jgi:vanillate O-demethylase monooxygenase subunit
MRLFTFLFHLSALYDLRRNTGNLLPMWTPVAPIASLSVSGMNRLFLDDMPYAVYYDKGWKIISDVCPHQGASLASGSLHHGCVVCPYHGFRFDDGRMTHPVHGRSHVLSLPTLVDRHNNLYTIPLVDKHLNPDFDLYPFYTVPEENDPDFSCISEYRILDVNHRVLTENVLDMLHISYVHSFGNRAEPFPFDIQHTRLNDTSGRTTFMYHSGPTSISKTIAQKDIILVENEYHLPSTTVTRVRAGDLVKTIVTQTVPYDTKKTGFFYKIYFNFYNKNVLSRFLTTNVLRYFMDKTLAEDIAILRNVYDTHLRMTRFMTKYDKTIMGYRKSRQKMHDRVQSLMLGGSSPNF